MADNKDEGGFKLNVIPDKSVTDLVDKLKDLEGISVPDIAAETAPAQDEDRLVQAWVISPVCTGDADPDDTFGAVFGAKRKASRAPGTCCRDRIVEIPLSEAKAKGYALVTGDEPYGKPR